MYSLQDDVVNRNIKSVYRTITGSKKTTNANSVCNTNSMSPTV